MPREFYPPDLSCRALRKPPVFSSANLPGLRLETLVVSPPDLSCTRFKKSREFCPPTDLSCMRLEESDFFCSPHLPGMRLKES